MWEPINPHKNVILFCLYTIRNHSSSWITGEENMPICSHARDLEDLQRKSRYFQSNEDPWLRYMLYYGLKSMAKFQKIICLTLQACADEFGSRWPQHLLKQLLRKNFLQPWYMYSIFTVADSKRYIWEIWITSTFLSSLFPTNQHKVSNY